MKLAMIGSYGHTGVVLDGAGQLSDVELSAVARWGADDPLSYVGKHPSVGANVPVYDDYRAMLDKVRPDVVGVFMPLYRNAEASVAAAEAGCHVISEKPLATTLEDLARLRQAVGKAGVRVAALLNLRGEPAFLAVRSLVADGVIGEPILATGQKSYPFATRDDFYKRRETYGGSIPWQAIHAIDFISFCTGRDYVRVAAMHSNTAHPSHPGMEDSGALLLELTGGGQAVVGFDYLRPWPGEPGRRWGDDRLRIAGSEATVEIVDEGTRVRLMTASGIGEAPLPEAKNVFVEFAASLAGSGEGLISTSESFRATEVALKAREAADTGRAVAL